jgi:CzcA family heavy metal efflux pump
MLNSIIRFSLQHRLLVFMAGFLVLVYGTITVRELPVDVFPDLTKPTVTILVEANALAPEEVETLILVPLENSLKGLPQMERLRSIAGQGLAVLYLEFAWGSDIYRNRQLVSEKLINSSTLLPSGVTPILGPLASLMGQIQQIALSSNDQKLTGQEIRTLADWVIRPRLMSIDGISQVIAIGGGVKQYQIIIHPEKLREYQIGLDRLNESIDQLSLNTSGGYQAIDEQYRLIRNIGAVSSIDDIKNTYIGHFFDRPVSIKDIAEVTLGDKLKVGDGGYNGNDAVILSIQKQPLADTVMISAEVDRALQDLRSSLPESLIIDSDVFQQAHFIQRSIEGVISKLWMGSLLVFLVLLIFLSNFRMSIVTVAAIPLSFLVTFVVMSIFGLTVNTMTLGGLAIAIGELVDDSIVDVENIFRRVKEAAKKGTKQSLLQLIYKASSEVRNSIFLSTVIIFLVFLPLFFLSGLEGRLLAPLGIAYLTALGASLLVSLTITPVLSYYLFRGRWKYLDKGEDSWLLTHLKRAEGWLLARTLKLPKVIIGISLISLLVSVGLVTQLGRDFLPPFNEGTALLTVVKQPDISWEKAREIGQQVEQKLMAIEGIKSTSRKTGRSEEDEHIMPLSVSEIDINFDNPESDKESILQQVRDSFSNWDDITISVGQQLSHLMDHMLSGVSAQLAVKIFAGDLSELRQLGAQAYEILKQIDGLVDIRLEQQVLIPQLKLHVLREESARNYFSPTQLVHHFEGMFLGRQRGYVFENDRSFEIYSFFRPDIKNDIDQINALVLTTLPNGRPVTVYDVADVYEGMGPNEIYRENSKRRILVSANIVGRDQRAVVKTVEAELGRNLNLAEGQYFTLGGQFEAEEQAAQNMLFYGFISLLLLTFVLYVHFNSWVLTLQVMISLPLAFCGGVVALYLVEGRMTVASMVGFIALAGIASRNAIMLLTHYLHLMKYEGETFTQEMVIRGTQERLAPLLMTALTAIFALAPLLFAKGQAGSEILYPVALVMSGGLISSTFLDVFITPVLFYHFAKKSVTKVLNNNEEEF